MSKLDQHVFLLSCSSFRLVIFLSFPEIQKRSLKQNSCILLIRQEDKFLKCMKQYPERKGGDLFCASLRLEQSWNLSCWTCLCASGYSCHDFLRLGVVAKNS